MAALQEQLEQLRALEQARGMPSPSTSDTPRVIAAQLQIEQLQRQLRSALQVILWSSKLKILVEGWGNDTEHNAHQARAVHWYSNMWQTSQFTILSAPCCSLPVYAPGSICA